MNNNTSDIMLHFAKCRRLMKWHRINSIIRILVTMAVGYFNIFYLGFASNKRGMSLILGAAILYAVILVMAFLTLKNKKIFVWSTIALFLTGIITGLILSFLGIFPLFLFLWHLREIKQQEWLCQQEGYPQFNPRFTFQEREKAKSDELRYTAVPKPVSDKMEEIDTQDILAANTAGSGQIPEMPDLENYFIPKTVSTKTSIPEAAADAAEDAAPMASEESEPVLDTSSILSSVPEINGDIQELPDIPDIPRI